MITCVIFVLGALIYGLFATAELQPWAVEKKEIENLEIVQTSKDSENSKI